VLEGESRQIYLACDAIADVDSVMRAAGTADRAATVATLQAMVARGLIVADGNRYVALAVPLGDYTSGGVAASHLMATLGRVGQRRGASVHVPLDRPEFQLGAAPRVPRPAPVRRRTHNLRVRRADVRIRRGELRVRPLVVRI
jgi:hypothetical protein